MTECRCFTCTHKSPPVLVGYYTGYVEACDWFLNWAKAQGVKIGSISDNDLGGIYAQIRCNRDDSAELLSEIKESLRTKHRETQKKWAANNKDKIRAQARRYYKKNAKKLSAESLRRYYKRKGIKNEEVKDNTLDS